MLHTLRERSNVNALVGRRESEIPSVLARILNLAILALQ